MPTNKGQHLVSQFTIRQFLGGRERLYCLNKATMEIADRERGNLPADILKEPYYYTTDDDDFDGEIVWPLENSLAPLLQALAEDHESAAAGEGVWAKLVDWCALSATRSAYFGRIAPIAFDSLSDEDKAGLPPDPKAMTLVARRAVYHRVRSEMRSARMSFRFLASPRDFGYYLTDHLATGIPFKRVGAIGPMLLPLSHKLMLIAVPMGIAEEFLSGIGEPTLEWLTLNQCGWARRLIYSADLESLDFARAVLTKDWKGDMAEMGARARQPFFGLAEPDELASIWAKSRQDA